MGVSFKKRQHLHNKQGGKCYYCNVDMVFCGPTTAKKRGCQRLMTTVDHLTPQSQGGTHDLNNLVAACYRCNSKRGIMPYHLFMWVVKNISTYQWPQFAKRWQSAENNAETEFRLIMKLRQPYIHI